MRRWQAFMTRQEQVKFEVVAANKDEARRKFEAREGQVVSTTFSDTKVDAMWLAPDDEPDEPEKPTVDTYSCDYCNEEVREDEGFLCSNFGGLDKHGSQCSTVACSKCVGMILDGAQNCSNCINE